MGHPEWKPQRAVFVADDDQGIWIVDNPEAVRDFPATHVVLAGKFDSTKKIVEAAAQTDGIIFHLWWPDGAKAPNDTVKHAQSVGHKELTAKEYSDK